MNKILSTALSILFSYVFIIILSTPLTAIFASIPLYVFKVKKSLIAGLLIGFFVPITLYIFYPLDYTIKLSVILSSIVGFPGILLIFLYPLIYGLLMAFSGALWSGIYERVVK